MGKTKIAAKILLLIGLIGIAHTVLAAYEIPKGLAPDLAPFSKGLVGNTPEQKFNILLQIIAGGLVYLAAPIAIFMIAFYGWQLVISMGGSESLEAPKKGLTWAIIGLLIILISVALIRNVIEIVVSTEDLNVAPTTPPATTATAPGGP